MRKAPKNMGFAHDQMDGVFELYSDQRRKVHSTTTEDGIISSDNIDHSVQMEFVCDGSAEQFKKDAKIFLELIK